jgi:aerobic carbon-monoxide dehydrogenase large subunit
MVKFATGQPVTRIEDAKLLQGKGQYTDDITVPNAAHAFVLRSPHANARFARIDTRQAAAAPGVVGVLTYADVQSDGLGDMPCLISLTNTDGSKQASVPRPILANGHVRHVGDPLALVVAETLQQAKDAAELIHVDYELLPAVTDTVAAARPGAPQVWEHIPGNLCFDWQQGDKAAVEAAFRRAKHTARVEIVNNRVVANPLEPRAAIADYDPATDRSTLYTPTQGPHLILPQLAETVLKIDRSKLRCVTRNVGGSFGMKIFLYPEQCLTLWASRRLKRAVRWVGERIESFLSDAQGRDNFSVAELALDQDGRFLALRVVTHANLGAYLSNFGPFIPTYGTAMLVGLYKTPAVYVNVKGVMTNTVPTDAYRGAGRPEAIYVIERVVDVAARELGLGPDEIRRRNFIVPGDMPYATPLGHTYDSGDFRAVMEQCMKKADWTGFPARRAAAHAHRKLRGIGMATYIEVCGGGEGETTVLKVDASGTVTLLMGMQDSGQGHVTTQVQILAERLGIDPEVIQVLQGDTDLTPSGFTGGSRFLAISGAAAAGAADKVIEKGKQIAAKSMEVSPVDVEFSAGRFAIAGTDRSMTLFEVAAAAHNPANLAAGLEPGLDATFRRTPEAATYPNGCHIAEVEIDQDTGEVDIVRYSVVDDFGKAISPNLLAGQVHGGIVQGIGQALLERTVYDDGSGQLLSASFMDYTLPRADDVPYFDFSMNNVPCTTNPMGVKGAGEAGAIGAPPAVINAVVDAVHAVTGATNIDMPATPERVWRAIQT